MGSPNDSGGPSAPVDHLSKDGEERLEDRELWRRAAAEVVGTLLLTFVAAGAEVVARLHPEAISPATKAVAPGLVVLAMIYAVSDVSGAHLNPAVTLSFALRGDFHWRSVPAYWGAQVAGAAAAAGMLRGMFGPVAHLGTSTPHATDAVALAIEVTVTAALVLVILGTATRAGTIGPQAALAVGATIALNGLLFGPVSGASMNPARSLGPALVSGHAEHLWLYVVGPTLGGLVAVLLIWLIKGPSQLQERVAAEGERRAHKSP